MPANLFESGAATVQFASTPLRQGGESPQLFQATGLDSAGDRYVYDKARICRTVHNLVFNNVSAALVAALDGFLTDTARGSKNTFTWHDHLQVARTVRIVGDISRVPVGPGRFRVSLTLEEDVTWALPSGSSLAGKTAAPAWVLRWTINDVVYYLADATFTITPWGVTTKPWVRVWGKVLEGITNSLGEFRVADFDVNLLVDAASNPNMETLAVSYPLEKLPASLYLYDLGAGTLREVFRGYAGDIDLPDNTTVNIVFEDESSRQQNYVGTKVDRTTYPSADPDDVGKVIPIVLNDVVKLPALAIDAGIMTTLPAAITAVAVSIPVSDATGIAEGMTLVCDAEEMSVTAVSGDTLTVTRGVNATVAVLHQRGARIWQKKDEFVYFAADHAVDSIGKVYGKVGDGLLDITAICVSYPAGDHPSHPGKAVVCTPGYVTIEQAVNLLIADGIGINDAKSLIDNITVVDGVTVVDGISVSDLISVVDPGHYHNAALSSNENTTSQLPTGNAGTDSNYGWWYRLTMGFPADGARTSESYSVTIKMAVGSPIGTIRIYFQGGYYASITRSWSQNESITLSTSTIYGGSANTIDIVCETTSFSVTAASRTVQFANNQSSGNVAGVYRSGSAAKDGTVSKSGTVTKSGTASLSGSVTKTGTVTLSGNSVANTLVGDQILVNVTKTFATPLAALQWLSATYGNGLPIVQSGVLPASYALTGAITEYRQLREWLNVMAFQLRCWFRVGLGSGTLVVRPDAYVSGGTITACRITEDGVKAHSRRKVEIVDVVNTINLLYDRDWAQSGDKAYRQCSKGTHAQSIIDNGVRENPDLFRCDFVTSPTHADSLRDFYLAWHGPRRWLHTFQTYLDQVGLQFGDIRTLGFAGNAVGQIIEAGPAPGDIETIDTVQFTALV